MVKDIYKIIIGGLLFVVLGLAGQKMAHGQSGVSDLDVPAGYTYLGTQSEAAGFVIIMQKANTVGTAEFFFVDVKSDGAVNNYSVKEHQ